MGRSSVEISCLLPIIAFYEGSWPFVTSYIKRETNGKLLIQDATMLCIPEILLEQYRISPENGFLPGALPSQRLQDSYYEPWEDIAHDLPLYIKTGNIRQAVDNLPILSISKLDGESEWRRAYVVLAYLTHAYVWGGEKPKDVSPIRLFLGPSSMS